MKFKMIQSELNFALAKLSVGAFSPATTFDSKFGWFEVYWILFFE